MKRYKLIENGIEYDLTEYPDGNKYWFYKTNLHRENGPAVVKASGDKWWYKHGKCHREDGPAIEFLDGRKEYWLNGIYYPNITSLKKLQIELNNLIIKEIIE